MGPETGTLSVPGASLHYQVRGNGPPLLVLPSGSTDADGSAALAGHLAASYRVITYDRRGMARSPLSDPADIPRIETHALDAHLLLAELCPEPASLFGCSTGAVIGLELTTRHPEQVSVLVAHEPPALSLLDEEGRRAAIEFADRVAAKFRDEGRIAALRFFGRDYVAALADREPGLPWGPPGARQIANMEFFLAHDSTVTTRHVLDDAALRAVAVRVLPGRGEASRATAPYRCAEALADLLAVGLTVFPGGHEGYLTHPRAFADALLTLLDSEPDGRASARTPADHRSSDRGAGRTSAG